jgi:hypothetical protein
LPLRSFRGEKIGESTKTPKTLMSRGKSEWRLAIMRGEAKIYKEKGL